MVTEFCPTQAARVGQNSLKDRPKVAWRTGDRAEYLGGRRLFLQRLGQMPPHLVGTVTGPPFAPIAACEPPKSPIRPELCRTHLGLPDARTEFEPGILVLLQCGALRRPALPGMQSREHDPKRLQGPRCEMQHKQQRHFAFVLRRWLTWFYPQVCPNQALSGASTFLFCPSMSATASADC